MCSARVEFPQYILVSYWFLTELGGAIHQTLSSLTALAAVAVIAALSVPVIVPIGAAGLVILFPLLYIYAKKSVACFLALTSSKYRKEVKLNLLSSVLGPKACDQIQAQCTQFLEAQEARDQRFYQIKGYFFGSGAKETLRADAEKAGVSVGDYVSHLKDELQDLFKAANMGANSPFNKVILGEEEYYLGASVNIQAEGGTLLQGVRGLKFICGASLIEELKWEAGDSTIKDLLKTYCPKYAPSATPQEMCNVHILHPDLNRVLTLHAEKRCEDYEAELGNLYWFFNSSSIEVDERRPKEHFLKLSKLYNLESKNARECAGITEKFIGCLRSSSLIHMFLGKPKPIEENFMCGAIGAAETPCT